MQIYIHRNNEQLGPFTEAEVRAQLASGAISPQDHVWWQGQANWIPLGQSPLAVPGTPLAPSQAITAPAVGVKTSGLAMASLITGIVSTILCGSLFIPAIILGHLGLSATKRPEVQGRGLAVTGLVLGYVQLVILCVVLFLFSAPILALIGLGAVAKAQLAQVQAQLNSGTSDNTTQTTNSDQTTNAPDQTTPAPATTNSAPAATNSPDQSTNSAPATTNSPDQSTNSTPATTNSPTPSTNAPDNSTNAPTTSTNATPMSP
jgi:uncharacterized protein DUF4339/uncharacterized protein DUF4190